MRKINLDQFASQLPLSLTSGTVYKFIYCILLSQIKIIRIKLLVNITRLEWYKRTSFCQGSTNEGALLLIRTRALLLHFGYILRNINVQIKKVRSKSFFFFPGKNFGKEFDPPTIKGISRPTDGGKTQTHAKKKLPRALLLNPTDESKVRSKSCISQINQQLLRNIFLSTHAPKIHKHNPFIYLHV